MNNKFFGLYRGTVINNKDPLGRMRIVARIPDVLGESPSSWALPCVPPGVRLVPAIGTRTWIEFEAGDPDYPVWIGTTGDPGVYIDDVSSDNPIMGVSTSITAFIGRTRQGPLNTPCTVFSYSRFKNHFGELSSDSPLAYAVGDFFANGGREALIVRIFRDDGTSIGLPPDEVSYQAAFDALRKTDMFNLLCLPPDSASRDVDSAVLQGALKLCVDRKAILIVDPRNDWSTATDVLNSNKGLSALGLSGDATRNAAVFFPHTKKTNPSGSGQVKIFRAVPCGAIAGVMARTDETRGIWKSAAGRDAEIRNIQGLSVSLTNRESDELNSLGVNCLRNFPGSLPVVWGARTFCGKNVSAGDYRYIPVRRLALYIEESLNRGLRWTVFESNDESLWTQIRQNVGIFMQNLFMQGAFQGGKAEEAYFVKCDSETTLQADINLGTVNIVIGFAPLKQREFLILRLQQNAGHS